MLACHDTPTDTIRRRILNVLPAATFQMHKMLQMVEVVLSDRSPSACMECGPRPRLHLNPVFLEKYCQRDEHLFMLIMHELNHLILGHTRLFKRTDQAANIAFDAVINAMLCHQFPGPEYTSFFTALNPPDEMPGCLLRPPEGWVGATRGSMERGIEIEEDCGSLGQLPDVRERSAHRMIRQLYNWKTWRYLTYQEIFEALRNSSKSSFKGEALLLGDHDQGEGLSTCEEEVRGDPTLKHVLRRVVSQWPSPPNPIAGIVGVRGRGADPNSYLLPEARERDLVVENALKKLLARAAASGSASSLRRLTTTQSERLMETILPQPRDRRSAAHRALWGTMPIFYRGECSEARRRLSPIPVCHLYFDISASMNSYLPSLVSALAQPHRKGLMKAFVFSTVVGEVAPRQLTKASLPNTYGTNIACVLEHFLEIPKPRRPRRILILTDGFVGLVSPSAMTRLRKSRTKVFVGLTPGGHRGDLEKIATHFEVLPISFPE